MMDSYEMPPLWDLSNTDPGAQEFFDLLHKQFAPLPANPVVSGFPPFVDGVNPQNLSLYPFSNLTPSSTSEDSSPSPPTTNQDTPQDGNGDDPTLKRKASANLLESEPTNKAQHTTLSDKRAPTGATLGTRRKSSGQTGKDEQRLLRRKEQNRAAQRAFRERKEKHVKDLEDKVAELEAKNEAAQHENENLRDMLSRLQTENLTLKQSAFTFSVPKDSTPKSDNTIPCRPVFSAMSPAHSVSSSSTTLPSSPKPINPLNWSSLTTFNPNVLDLLDNNTSQSTATDDAMRMDFGFGDAEMAPTPLTIIADNPLFTTLAFDFKDPIEPNSVAGAGTFNNAATGTSNNANTFNFDMNMFPSWQTPTQSNSSVPDPIFDDLFRGYLSSLAPPQFPGFTGSTPSISPITHHTSPSRLSSGSSSSPSTLDQDLLFTRGPSSSTTETDNPTHSANDCAKVKSREGCRDLIAQEGSSMFAPPIQKNHDQVKGPTITCAGSSFPKTEKNDRNIEVLTALKNIQANPKFKDVDITELCHQFTKKACCDGTKVVLEPAAVTEIMDNLAKSRGQ